MSRARRTLTRDERRLWAEVARAVTPLKGRAPPEPEPDPPAIVPSASPSPPAPRRAEVSPAPARAPAPPPLVPLERATRVSLRRRRGGVDAVLDLHGLRQAEAHDRLIGFLMRARAHGHGLVLIITGKGGGEGGSLFDERGVLRRAVPHWLARPDLRPLVLGFETAAPHHGGAGALYVRLRRARTPMA